MYSHRPASGLERGPDPSIPDFYREDELKYHGKVNRGVDTIDFMGELHLERSFQGNAVTDLIETDRFSFSPHFLLLSDWGHDSYRKVLP